ncbi:MAG TPA: DUF4382 domain-containing protein [Gammaproteobacteria bacterium]|jgi:hypothetical protein
MLNRMMKTATLALAALLLASCGGGTRHGITLSITDAPIDLASSVNVSFAQIKLSGPHVVPTVLNISPAASVDLFQLQGGLTEIMADTIQAQPGDYDTLTLTILADEASGQSNITLPDGVHILYVPPGVSPKVNLPVKFTFNSGGDLFLTVDFDLRKSIVQDPNNPTKYQLFPTMRVVEDQLTGSITGNVATPLVTCLEPAVYVYSGDVTPTDVDISDPQHVNPISTALVGLNSTSGLYNFTAGFLPAGEYTIAFSCNAQLDVANQANTLSFSRVLHVMVDAQQTTFVSFQ